MVKGKGSRQASRLIWTSLPASSASLASARTQSDWRAVLGPGDDDAAGGVDLLLDHHRIIVAEAFSALSHRQIVAARLRARR